MGLEWKIFNDIIRLWTQLFKSYSYIGTRVPYVYLVDNFTGLSIKKKINWWHSKSIYKCFLKITLNDTIQNVFFHFKPSLKIIITKALVYEYKILLLEFVYIPTNYELFCEFWNSSIC